MDAPRSAATGWVRVDAEGRIVGHDRARVAVALLSRDDLVGRTWRELGLGAAFVDSAERAVAEARTSGGAIAVEAAPDATRDLELVATSIDTGDAFVTVTLRAAPSSRRGQASDTAEGLLDARDEIVAVLSHELRSPLNGIQTWTHVLESAIGDGEHDSTLAARAVQGIRKGVTQQVRIVDDLLDTALALSGRLEKIETRLDVGALVLTSRDRLADVAREAGVAVEVSGDLGAIVVGDGRHLARAIDHLVGNAIRFSGAGGRVRVTVGEHPDRVELRFDDAGPRFPREFAGRAFDAFARADRSLARRVDGLGSGLTLARLVVELHGGSIELGPAMRDGGSVIVRLPLVPAATLAAVAVTAPRERAGAPGHVGGPLPGLDIIVIDDQNEARESLSAMLTGAGTHVRTYQSASEALADVGGDVRWPDAIVCDLAMPGMDGFAFLRRFRDLERDAGRTAAQRTPVFALSAYIRPRDFEPHGECFDRYLSKPVEPAELIDCLARRGATAR